jgi:hypothetical protein
MESLVIHTGSKEQLDALKALIKSWKISFEKYPYNSNFLNEIKRRENNVAVGDVIIIKDPKNIWDSIL